MARFTTQTALEGCHMIMHRISGGFSCAGLIGLQRVHFLHPKCLKSLEEPMRAQQYKQV